MAAAELETVARLGLPMVVVIYDDRGYGAEVHHFAGADHTTVTFPDTDIAAIGRGFGFDAVTVRTPDDLKAVAQWVDGPRTAPMLVDAKIASDGGSWWLAEAFRGH
jgi:thiamine pyrophosphate-dependent acetolactate synthase large subunit-like protein